MTKNITYFIVVLSFLSCKTKLKDDIHNKPIDTRTIVDTSLFNLDTLFVQNGFTYKIWLGKTENNQNKFVLEKQDSKTDVLLFEESLYNQQYLLTDFNGDMFLDIEFPTRQFRPSTYYIFNSLKNVYVDNGKWMSYWEKIDTNLYYNYLDEELKECSDIYSTIFKFNNFKITPIGEIALIAIPYDSCNGGTTFEKATIRKIDQKTQQTIWSETIDKATIDSFTDKETKSFKQIEFFNFFWKRNKNRIEAN